MLKRILNISLIFVLLLSVIGVSTTKVYCAALKTTMEKKCCGDQERGDNNCCKEVKESIKLSTDLSLESASVKVPDITLFAFTFLNIFNNLIVKLDLKHNYSAYNPPSVSLDISVLIQVFRI